MARVSRADNILFAFFMSEIFHVTDMILITLVFSVTTVLNTFVSVLNDC